MLPTVVFGKRLLILFWPIGRSGGARKVSSPEPSESTWIIVGPELGNEPGVGLEGTVVGGFLGLFFFSNKRL